MAGPVNYLEGQEIDMKNVSITWQKFFWENYSVEWKGKQLKVVKQHQGSKNDVSEWQTLVLPICSLPVVDTIIECLSAADNLSDYLKTLHQLCGCRPRSFISTFLLRAAHILVTFPVLNRTLLRKSACINLAP